MLRARGQTHAWLACSVCVCACMCVCACAGPELPLLQQLGRLPINVPSQEAASSTLPPGWRVWHDPLQLFAVINPPFISATSNMNPEGSLHTGHFNMLLYEGLPGVLGRVQALTFLAKAETGSHLNSRSLLQDKVCVGLCRSCLLLLARSVLLPVLCAASEAHGCCCCVCAHTCRCGR